jgi:hypothetical protein
MFAPTQAEVRRFFCAVYAKSQASQPMEAIEQIAAQWIAEHPEYHATLTDEESALAAQYPSDGAGDSRQMGNPFLHLSMHLSITEQCSIDQPRGIRQAVELLTQRKDDLHAAHHAAMDCLGQMLWDAQRNKAAPDGEAYVACVQRKATAI